MAILKMLGPVAWLAIAAGLQMTGALLFFKTAPAPSLVTAYILITFGIYLLNKFTDTEDGFNYPEQRMFFQKQSTLLLIPIALLSFSVLLLTVSKRSSFWHIALIASGIIYSLKLIPQWNSRSIHFVRLKDILFVKNISVSVLWGITPFAIAASQPSIDLPSTADLTVIILAFCITTLINTTSCDVRDIIGDRHAGIRTVATTFGKVRTGLFLFYFGLLASTVVGIFFLAGTVSQSAFTLFMVTMVWTGVVALPVYFERIRIPRMINEPLIDTQQIVCGAALLTLVLL